MAEPFLSEIRIFAFGFAPKGWALCNGQLLPINQNQALFSLLGTNWGGDGRVNFALPNMQGRVPIHVGNGHQLQPDANPNNNGQQAITLTVAQMPLHAHLYNVNSTPATTNNPAPTGTTALATSAGSQLYGPLANVKAMDARAVGVAGGGQPHTNMQPFLTLDICIALQGIFPSQN